MIIYYFKKENIYDIIFLERGELMNYHRPIDKQKILLGEREEYDTTIPLVDEFSKRVFYICQELAKYDLNALQEFGIVGQVNPLTSERDYSSYKFENEAGTYYLYCIDGKRFDARTLTPAPAEMPTPSYPSRLSSFHLDTLSDGFSFEGNDMLEGKDPLYLDGGLLLPDENLTFDESRGFYVREYGKQGAPEHNEMMKKVLTTYPSFEVARQEMAKKTEAFVSAWNNQLEMLNQQNQEKGL